MVANEISEGVIAKIERKAAELMSALLDNPAVVWNISSIPLYGPILSTILTSLEPAITKRRFLELMKSLREETLLIDQTKIDTSFFETEEFYDLLRRVLEYSLKTRHNEKIRLYSKILVRTALLDNTVFRHSAEDFLMTILELSPPDLFVAREVYRQQKNLPEKIESIEQNELQLVKQSAWDELPTICHMDESEFKLSTIKLVRTGLLQQVIGTYSNYIGNAYRITPVFRRIIQLVGDLN